MIRKEISYRFDLCEEGAPVCCTSFSLATDKEPCLLYIKFHVPFGNEAIDTLADYYQIPRDVLAFHLQKVFDGPRNVQTEIDVDLPCRYGTLKKLQISKGFDWEMSTSS